MLLLNNETGNRMALEMYELMADDLVITAELQKDDDIRVTVTNENEDVLFDETSHPFAWDSLVYFATQIIRENEKIERLRMDRE